MKEFVDSTELRTEQNVPIVIPESLPPIDVLKKQWEMITEALRRDILTKPEVRKTLIVFCNRPVTETLPDELIASVIHIDERIARLAERYNDSLRGYLALPAVPDEMIVPDIRNASGITSSERKRIATRYAMARDVKLLVLGADVLEQPTQVTTNEVGEVILPSGVQIVLGEVDASTKVDLLSPQAWEKRKQLKDRVYEIYVNGKKYLLKEKKTARHTDTLGDGHEDGLMSSEEFFTAQEFIEKASIIEGNIAVGWEKPLGFVTFPDGFQFAVFEFREGLIPYSKALTQTAEAILRNRDQFDGEFQNLIDKVDAYLDSPTVLAYPDKRRKEVPPSFMQRLLKRVGLTQESPLELSFEEFANVKALRMLLQALSLKEKVTNQMGYSNSDWDGYAFTVHTDRDAVVVEIVGFDFEYYTRISAEEQRRRSVVAPQISMREESKNGLYYHTWVDSDETKPVTRMERAAYFALLEQEGILDTAIRKQIDEEYQRHL